MTEIYLPCRACGKTMTGILSYLIRKKMRYLCYDCKTALNEFSQQIVLSPENREKFKELLRIDLTGK